MEHNMKTLRIDIEDDSKINVVKKILNDLGYVTIHDSDENNQTGSESGLDGVIGLWKDRDISLESIRKKAWSKK